MDKQKIIIIILSVVIFSLLQYVIYEKVTESISEKINFSYQSGYNDGFVDAVEAIYKQTENCQATNVTIGNLTKNVLDLSCVDLQSGDMKP